MSVRYGEGTRAFLRLQTKLAKEMPSLDIFEWSAGCSKYHPMFASGPHCFETITESAADNFVKFIHDTSWTRSDLPSPAQRWTWEQCHTAAKMSVPRGDVSFRMTKERLHIALILYSVLSPPPLSLFRRGKLCLSAITTATCSTLTTRLSGKTRSWANWSTLLDLVVGVLDYEWGDANGKPVMSSKGAITNVHLRQLLDAPGEGLLDQHIVAARKNRAYTAVILQAMQPECYQWMGWLTVKHPEKGWRKPETVQVF
ncbi:hypothetical protein B0H21DRAFT_839177 [Amylocystis lapponica]|nr:hypothetical protein B0H21DRAFT_839177 [Amylocystis lapponica]